MPDWLWGALTGIHRNEWLRLDEEVRQNLAELSLLPPDGSIQSDLNSRKNRHPLHQRRQQQNQEDPSRAEGSNTNTHRSRRTRPSAPFNRRSSLDSMRSLGYQVPNQGLVPLSNSPVSFDLHTPSLTIGLIISLFYLALQLRFIELISNHGHD